MARIVLIILTILLAFYNLSTGKDCDKTDIIEGRLGKELAMTFSLKDLRDKYNKYITERYGKRIIQTEIQIQDLIKQFDIWFKKKEDSMIEHIIFKAGNPTYLASKGTKLFKDNDAIVVKITDLQKEDVGIYWIKFRSITLGQKTLVIAGKFTIKGRSPLNPILIANDNHAELKQFKCPCIATNIGVCQLPVYIIWYKNGIKMSNFGPTLSHINVKMDSKVGSFTCLATDYLLCYQRLKTTEHYDGVFNFEECDNVYEIETFIIKHEQTEKKASKSPQITFLIVVNCISILVMVTCIYFIRLKYRKKEDFVYRGRVCHEKRNQSIDVDVHTFYL